jgi:hypothetical protein
MNHVRPCIPTIQIAASVQAVWHTASIMNAKAACGGWAKSVAPRYPPVASDTIPRHAVVAVSPGGSYVLKFRLENGLGKRDLRMAALSIS